MFSYRTIGSGSFPPRETIKSIERVWIMKCFSLRFRLKKARALISIVLIGAFVLLNAYFHMRTETWVYTIMFAALAFVEIDMKNCQRGWLIAVFVGILTALACVVCAQSFVYSTPIYHVVKEPKILALNILSYFAIYMFAYGLTSKAKWASLVTTLLVFFVSIVNFCVIQFRGTAFQFVDLLFLQTAMQVAPNYTISVNAHLSLGILASATWIAALLCNIDFPRSPQRMRYDRILSFILAGFCFTGAYFGSANLRMYPWLDEGTKYNGLLPNMFHYQIASNSYSKLKGYDSFDISAIENSIVLPEPPDRKPNVIVIMGEAFSDLRVYSGQLNTTEDVTPFYDSLEENTIKGYALASVYGGTTANSEYEFLTGNTMAFFPPGTSPFQQYVEEGDCSIVSHMKSMGYRTVGMHPAHSQNWHRNQAWENFGFDNTYFEEDYPTKQIIHAGVSDQQFVEQLLLQLNQQQDIPLFLFGITMQNHGGYTRPTTQTTIHLQDYQGVYPEAEQYLSLLHLSDKALKYLINQLEEIATETVLLYFGDHQPKIETEFLEELNGMPLSDLSQTAKMYTVPFLIWANYDIPEQQIPLTSLNYLGGYLMDVAGLPRSPYQQYLKQLESDIPALNAFTYQSFSGEFHSYDKAIDREAELLQTYRFLQYHNLNEDNRSTTLFPH